MLEEGLEMAAQDQPRVFELRRQPCSFHSPFPGFGYLPVLEGSTRRF